MITKLQAETCSMFYDATLRNADGSAKRYRANGKTKTWKRDPNRFRVPVKHGMYDYGYIDNDNAHNYLCMDPTSLNDIRWRLNLKDETPVEFVIDKLIDLGLDDVAEAVRKEHLQTANGQV